MDQTGKPTSDALHVTERFRRTDFGHMEIQMKEQVRLVTNYDLIESPCENNLDLRHLGGKFSK